jgi:hypothetical protein
MADLVPCPSCGHKVSSEASACPSCGQPSPAAEPFWMSWAPLLGVLLLLIFWEWRLGLVSALLEFIPSDTSTFRILFGR